MSLLQVRLAIALAGVATWGYGVRFDRAEVRWLGIAFLAISVLLRFARGRRPPRHDEVSREDGE